MAEFQKIAKHWKRMCKKYWRPTTCHGCPIAENARSYEACSDRDIDVAKMEELVTAWAAEHPEPVYPSWYAWLANMGIVPIELPPDQATFVTDIGLLKKIPADIAQKLGIEPKEGT